MLKAIDPNVTVAVAHYEDPAIDKETSNVPAYQEHAGRDSEALKKYLKPRDGLQLTVFQIGTVPAGVMARHQDQASGKNDLCWRLFLAGVKDIEGWATPVPKKDGSVDTEWLAKTFVRDLRLPAMFIGSCVFAFNTASEEDEKNS